MSQTNLTFRRIFSRNVATIVALGVFLAATNPSARAAEPIEPPQLNPAVFVQEVGAPPAFRPRTEDTAQQKQTPQSDSPLFGVGNMALAAIVTLGVEFAVCATTGICALTLPP